MIHLLGNSYPIAPFLWFGLTFFLVVMGIALISRKTVGRSVDGITETIYLGKRTNPAFGVVLLILGIISFFFCSCSWFSSFLGPK